MRNRLQLIPGWKGLLALGLPVLVGVGAVVGAYLYSSSALSGASPKAAPIAAGLELPPPSGLLVDVVGAVARPGLYRLPRGDRVYDAIAAAGGLTAHADPTRLPNLAGRLNDGEQIRVPFAKGATGSTVINRTSLNMATVEELALVPGFTEAFAQEAVDYRTNFGGFQTTSELVEILGMSESDFMIARRYLTL
ncbi:MAG TPA: helix-hairpin-helix domain-containing protein [Candidatus Dormibacteraeota bacterium]